MFIVRCQTMCKAWETCDSATYLHADTAKSRGVCLDCPAGKHTQADSHQRGLAEACDCYFEPPGKGKEVCGTPAPGPQGDDDGGEMSAGTIVVLTIVLFFVCSIVVVKAVGVYVPPTAPLSLCTMEESSTMCT